MKETKYNLITILGATATGKTTVAVALADRLNSEIISADSRQVYRGMDIGTGKDIDEYQFNGKQIPYHLIDIVDAGAKYNVYEYQKDFLKAYNEISAKDKLPVLCGGTGMYIDAVTKGYKLINVPVNKKLREELELKTNEELEQILKSLKNTHNKSDFDTRKRAIRAIEIEDYYKNNPNISLDYPKFNTLFIGIDVDRNTRRKRITNRLKARLEEGMIEEVESLIKSGIAAEDLIYYGLEYKFLTMYVTGEINRNDMFQKLESAIHQFAKRQMTWFRGMERKGAVINWIDGRIPTDEKIDKIISLL